MSQVDFYILPDDNEASLQQFACRRVMQHWQPGKRILIQTDTPQQSEQLDEQLWNQGADSFIPHGIALLEPQDAEQPVLITHQRVSDSSFQHVINLSSRPCDIQATDSEMSIDEILNQNEQRKQAGRSHYKTYRELGFSLQHHTLESVDG